MPLPTYQSSGLLSQPSPKLDFADLRESERSSQMMMQSLDRLSEFAFKAAAKQAVREGEQWAYNNPISDEQIMRAKKGAYDIALDQPKSGTFFGDSARKIQAGQLRATLELSARSDIAKIYELVEAGEIKDIKQLDDLFYGIQKGNGKVISRLDPDQANAFQASIATAANVVYQSAAKKIGEINAKQIEEQVVASLADFDSLIRPVIDKETDPKRLNDIIMGARFRILDRAVQANNVHAFTATQKALDTKIEKAYVDRVSNYFSSDEFGFAASENTLAAKLQAIDGGNTAKYSAVWKQMPTELQEKVRANFLKREGEKEKALQADEKIREKRNKEDSIVALDSYYKGDIGQEELVNTLIATNQATPTLLKSIYAKEEKPTDGKTLFLIGNQIDKGVFGRRDVEKYYADGKITLKESLDFIKQIKTESKDFADAKMILKGRLKLPSDGIMIGDQYKKQQEKYSELLADLVNASQQAIAAGKPFNPIAYANKMAVEGTSQLNQENIKKKDEALAAKWRNLGYTPPPDGTFFTSDELKRTPTPDKKGTLSKEDIKIILRLQKNAQEARE